MINRVKCIMKKDSEQQPIDTFVTHSGGLDIEKIRALVEAFREVFGNRARCAYIAFEGDDGPELVVIDASLDAPTGHLATLDGVALAIIDNNVQRHASACMSDKAEVQEYMSVVRTSQEECAATLKKG